MSKSRGLTAELGDLIARGDIGPDVVSLLLPNGSPLQSEATLWDYKRSLPIFSRTMTSTAKETFKLDIAEIAKDVVAFHNAHGGYLVIGIESNGVVSGFEENFDVTDLNARVEAATRSNIECFFGLIQINTEGQRRSIGLLCIPKRVTEVPTRFLVDSPRRLNGSYIYKKGDVYVRIRDQSRPAASNLEDWKFLFEPRTRSDSRPAARRKIKHNMPARDPDLVKFVGRGELLALLRTWFFDQLNPIRMLSGIGGVGKTSIAYQFANEVIEAAPSEIDYVIWVTGKKQTYSAFRGELHPSSRVDFIDTNSLLVKALSVLHSESALDENNPDRDRLIELLVEALEIYPSLIIVDDLDSLAETEQRDLAYTLQQVCLRTVAFGTPTRLLITSRLDQGLSPSQIIEVKGLELTEFRDYVQLVLLEFGLSSNSIISERHIELFHKAASGSPLFATSVLRLIRLGDKFESALNEWQGLDGEEVRRFAFERELRNLTDTQAKTLFAICLLSETSLPELVSILETSRRRVQDDIGGLQKYHLVVTGGDPATGPRLIAPSAIRLMLDLLKKVVCDAESIERACSRSAANVRRYDVSVGALIGKVVALWQQDDASAALALVEREIKSHEKSGDVWCLYGNAYLRVSPPSAVSAESAFRRARELNCRRRELLPGWIAAKQMLEDWAGILAISASDNAPIADITVLRHRINASEQLYRLARARNDLGNASKYCIEVVREIARAMDAKRVPVTQFDEIQNRQFDFATRYIEVAELRYGDRDNDHLAIFEAAVALFDASVTLRNIIEHALRRLESWWSAVMRRRYVDDQAKSILQNQLRRLERLESTLRRRTNAPFETIDRIGAVRRRLAISAYEGEPS